MLIILFVSTNLAYKITVTNHHGPIGRINKLILIYDTFEIASFAYKKEKGTGIRKRVRIYVPTYLHRLPT